MTKEESTGLSNREKFSISAIALLGVLAGIIYIGNASAPEWGMHPIISDYSYNYTDYTNNKVDLEIKKGIKGGGGVDLAVVGKPNPELIGKGKELFTQNCVACHGPEGKGNGPASVALNPKPRNFHSPDGWTNGTDMDKMFGTLAKGIATRGMPQFDTIPAADRFAILHYVRSLAGHFSQVTDAQLETIKNEYDLSGGGPQTIVQVPVKLAMENIIEENKGKVEDVQAKLMEINNNSTQKGAKLFNKLTKDRKEALAVLLNDENWRDDLNSFKTIVSYSTNRGFKGSAALMSGEDWTELHNFMKSVL